MATVRIETSDGDHELAISTDRPRLDNPTRRGDGVEFAFAPEATRRLKVIGIEQQTTLFTVIAAGFALFFHTFSTFLGRRSLWLEDLFVRPEHRGAGIGRALLTALAAIARERGCGRFEWAVLDWNTPAIDFYQSLGAVAMNDWTVYRLSRAALEKLAAPE